MGGFSTPIGEIEDDDELPTLSKILGRTTPYAFESERTTAIPKASVEPTTTELPQPNTVDAILNARFSETEHASPPAGSVLDAQIPTQTPEPEFTQPIAPEQPVLATETPAHKKPPPLPKKTETTQAKTSKEKKIKPEKKANQSPLKKPSLTDMVPPLVFFFMGLMVFGTFLIFTASEFTFIDYCVVFILFTCLIFTIAMPYGASIFFMILLLCSYVVLSLISVFYLEIPFEFYQIGWLLVIPMVLLSSALLIRKIRELFRFKKISNSSLLPMIIWKKVPD
ncbi:hypothetical protein [Acetobacterium wieringae]|uniref:hypothetical protein n=1 Tax=Acetobacterium wieringae TaxID=52694 RepID=UPI0020335C24|nr:hypothetical protein [Acetobacterium wieringae]URN83827.1 hypothetical protein CHL1_002987 [Acetobacterium wieringae]